MADSVPKTMKALVLEEKGKPLSLKSVPTPEVTAGSVLVKILASSIPSDLSAILRGEIPYLILPTPVIPGNTMVGRIAAVGPDTTTLKVGQLVVNDTFITGRDNHDVQILQSLNAGVDVGGDKLMDFWKDGAFAEYMRLPLEAVFAVNEDLLVKGLEYGIQDLTHLSTMVVGYGGLRGIDLRPGETVVIAPATGIFSGAAVEVASAMGARVIACGRSQAKLDVCKHIRGVETVVLSGDVEKDSKSMSQWGAPDAFLDLSPGQVKEPAYITAAAMALKKYGRMSIMGVAQGNLPVPMMIMVMKSLLVKGQYMYDKTAYPELIKMAETGLLPLGKKAGHEILGEYKLEDSEKALERADSDISWGKSVILVP